MLSEDRPSATLYPRRSSAIWLLVGCGVFVAIGIWMGVTGEWVGFLCAGFFALGLPVGGIQLLPGSTYLHLDESGFTFCNLFRKTSIPWSAVEGFSVLTLKQGGMRVHKMVGINFVPSYEGARTSRNISRALTGCDGGLPDTYGMKAEELAVALNSCLERFSESAES